MQNDYVQHRDGTVTLLLSRKQGGRPYEARLDTQDLPRVQELAGRWYATPRRTGGHNVLGNHETSDGTRQVYLHRWLLDAQPGTAVIHKDNDGLNNRRTNLISQPSGGLRRSTGPNRTNHSSGLRGVTLDRTTNRWKAQLSHGGKKLHLGMRGTREEAAALVQQKLRELGRT